MFVNFIKRLFQRGNVFKWRSECSADDDALLALIPAKEVVTYKRTQVGV